MLLMLIIRRTVIFVVVDDDDIIVVVSLSLLCVANINTTKFLRDHYFLIPREENLAHFA